MLVSWSGLAPGNRTLTVKVTGQKSAAAHGAVVAIDKVVISTA